MNALRITCGALSLAIAVLCVIDGEPPSPWWAPLQIGCLWFVTVRP